MAGETFFIADTHLDHVNVIKHCKRPFANVDEMNASIVAGWNAVVTNKDLVYIVGDFAWHRHRKWINELNGSKVLIIGTHDKMPQDVLDLFKPTWTCDEVTMADVLKTRAQFREVHHKLVRVICGQMMTLNHEPMVSWHSSVHGAWMIHGHCHGRMRCSLSGEIGGGLIIDVGWDIWKNPIPFDIVKQEMSRKFDMMPQSFKDHILSRARGRVEDD